MPSAGFSHFYMYSGLDISTTLLCVNALGGLFSFLLRIANGCYENRIECQCPRRAFLISTVPSGNPHKYGAPRLIFACICPNILKTTVFQDIFVLFIICSYFHWIFSPCLLYNSSFADKSIFCRNCSVSDDSVYLVFSKPKARVLPQMKKFTRDQIIQTFF